MNSNSKFSPKTGEPRWRDVVKIWNQNSDRMDSDDISYKVCPFEILSISLAIQIESLFNSSKSIIQNGSCLSHIKERLSLSAVVRKPLSLVTHDPLRNEGSCHPTGTKPTKAPYDRLKLECILSCLSSSCLFFPSSRLCCRAFYTLLNALHTMLLIMNVLNICIALRSSLPPRKHVEVVVHQNSQPPLDSSPFHTNSTSKTLS